MYSCGPLHTAVQKQDDQHEHTFINYVRIRDVVQKTCLRRWTIGKSGERGSGISVLPARHDDDDDVKAKNDNSQPSKCTQQGNWDETFYHLEYSDYGPHLYCYSNNVSVDLFFGFLQYFISNSETYTEHWTEPLILSTG